MNLRKELLNYYKMAYGDSLMTGTSGNASVLLGEDSVLITPSSLGHKKMTVQDLMVIDFDGNILEGEHKPSSEWRMHVAIYQNCGFAKAVFHTHSPYATAYAVADKEIPEILVEMRAFTDGAIPVSRFALAGSTNLGKNVADVLWDRRTCLMQNHGVVAVGDTIGDAFLRAAYVEDAAKICYFASNIGRAATISEIAEGAQSS